MRSPDPVAAVRGIRGNRTDGLPPLSYPNDVIGRSSDRSCDEIGHERAASSKMRIFVVLSSKFGNVHTLLRHCESIEHRAASTTLAIILAPRIRVQIRKESLRGSLGVEPRSSCGLIVHGAAATPTAGALQTRATSPFR